MHWIKDVQKRPAPFKPHALGEGLLYDMQRNAQQVLARCASVFFRSQFAGQNAGELMGLKIVFRQARENHQDPAQEMFLKNSVAFTRWNTCLAFRKIWPETMAARLQYGQLVSLMYFLVYQAFFVGATCIRVTCVKRFQWRDMHMSDFCLRDIAVHGTGIVDGVHWCVGPGGIPVNPCWE